MKKAPFLFTLILLSSVVFCCKQKIKNNTANKWQWTSIHKLPQLHAHFDSLYSATLTSDTAVVNHHFKFCFDTLEKLSDDTVTVYKTFVYYDNFYNILNSGKQHTAFFLKKKSKLLQYNIYLNSVYDKYNAVIKYYNILNTNEYVQFLPDDKKIGRMMDVGVAYNKTGDRAKTEETYLATLAVAKKIGDKNRIAQSLINLNIYLLEKQQYDTIIKNSTPYLSDDVAEAYKSKLAINIANAQLAKKDIAAALQNTTKGEQYLQSIDSAEHNKIGYNERLSIVYNTYATIYETKKDVKNADLYYEKALHQSKIAHNNTGRELGKLHLQIANYKQANKTSNIDGTPLHHINSAILCVDNGFNINDSLASPVEAAITDENLFFEAMDAKAKYCLENTKITTTVAGLEKIDKYYKAAFIAEKKLLNNFVYDNSKIDFLEYSKQRTALAVANCYKAYTLSKDKIWQTKAFEYIENSKATVLLEQLKKNKILQSTLATDSLVLQLDSLKKEMISTTNDNLSNIEKQKEEVEQLLKNKYPQLNEQNQFENSKSIATIQDALQKKTGLLNYFFVSDTLYQIYISKKQILFNKTIIHQNTILQYKNDCADINVQQQSPTAFFNTSYTLYKSLGLVSVSSNINELIIMPSDALHNFSFESLITKEYTNLNTINFLVNDINFNYCYSYATLLQNNNYNTAQPNILICTPASNTSINNQPILSFSKNEAAEIKKEYKKATHLDDKTATTKTFLSTYNNYRIVHLATHSISDTLSGNSSIDFYDASLLAQQLQQNNTLTTDLFFLSACETSLGKQTQNEGVLSLARSLYYAGAQNVIAAQWRINDAATSQIVASFYKNIKTKKYAIALQAAKKTYLKSNIAEKKLPFYWASLTPIGYQTYYKTSNYYWLALIGLIIFLGASVFLLKTKFKNSVKLRKINFFQKKH